MKRFIGVIFKGAHTLYTTTLALIGLTCVVAVAANYTMTQGSGTTFGSLVVGGVNFAQQLICDPTTTSQCAAVNASGQVSIGALPAGTAIVGKVGIDQTTPGTTNGVQVNAALPAGTNNIGFITPTPSTTGGWSKFSTPKNNSNTALTSTVVAVKSSAAGNFGGYYISNPNSAVSCVQVFDVATAGGVTLGTTRPDMVFCIPASSAANFEMVNGVNMTNGIQIAATTTASGSSAPSTGLDVTILYK